MTDEYFDLEEFVAKYEYLEQELEEYLVEEIENLMKGIEND